MTFQSATLRKIIHPVNISKVVPIVSNSFYINELLCNEKRLSDSSNQAADKIELDRDLSPDEQLTRLWSKSDEVHYPMADADGHDLARVAQYHQVNETLPVAKSNYLNYRKSKILQLNQEKTKRFPQLNSNKRYSDILEQLGYAACFDNHDPLDKLADMPFLNYVTTGYHDFLERALLKADKKPITQYLRLDDTRKMITAPIVDWAGNPLTAPIRDAQGNILVNIPNPQGTVGFPVVYHLFGFETDPESFILSEDDHIELLIAIVTDILTPRTNNDNKQSEQGQPIPLRTILSTNHLLLLGYQLEAWDFRVLFRVLKELRTSQQRPSVFLQIPPKKDIDPLLEYVIDYFKPNQFDVEQKHPVEFIQEIWEIYNAKPRI